MWKIYHQMDSDPTAYVLSANVHRRHLTKGQQAMATALAYPESEQGKRKTSLLNNEVSGGYIRQARFVLRHCRDKAEEVLRNAKYPLTVAYEAFNPCSSATCLATAFQCKSSFLC